MTPKDLQELASAIAVPLLAMEKSYQARLMRTLKEVDSTLWAHVRSILRDWGPTGQGKTS